MAGKGHRKGKKKMIQTIGELVLVSAPFIAAWIMVDYDAKKGKK